ncbi:hypothetical protein R84B8_02946 [Treponema sp. R8-4-B8]
MKKLILLIFFAISFTVLLTACADNSDAENTENTTTLQTVEFEPDGGTPVPQLQFVYYGKKVTEPAPMTRANYVFGGWYRFNKNYQGIFSNEYKWNFDKDIVTYNMTLYARWDLVKHKVTFESYGSTNAPDSQNVSHEGKINEPNTTLMINKNINLAFGGWYKEETFDTKWDFAVDTVTEDITLYAKWGYTITYFGWPAISYQVVIPGNKADKPAARIQTGFIFDDWYKEYKENTFTNKWDFTVDTVTENITLYAKWNPINYTVHYEKNSEDAFGTTADSPHAYGIDKPLTANGYARHGYVFVKWNTQSTGQGTDYTDAQLVKNFTPTDGDVIALYAIWGHTVDFIGDGGLPVPEQQIVVHGFLASDPVVLRRISRTDYFFCGWYKESDSVNKWVFNVNTVTENITLYARWVPNKMIRVYSGDFIMGQEEGKTGNGNLTNSHKVVLTKDFYIGKYEVTQELYQAVMGINPSSFKDDPAQGEIQKNRPVENVNWYDAILFCNQMSIAEGLTPAYRISGSTNPATWGSVPTNNNSYNKSNWDAAEFISSSNGYRLPTEAQWEYAAKGGSSNNIGWVGYTYSGSDTLDDVAWYADNSNYKTHEVGKKMPNYLGIYDMTGNVREWCFDRPRGYYKSTSGDIVDPIGDTSAINSSYDISRCNRGSWFYDPVNYMRLIYRNTNSPYTRYRDTGFRLVRP